LQTVVTTDGRTINITVVKGPGLELEVKAIEAVKKWRFKSAHDSIGSPVDVAVPIEVTFRLH
jgi:TonB family protein